MGLGIIGSPGAGKTTALCLFNQANLKYTQKDENSGHRFLLDPEYQSEFSDMYGSMVGHKTFPPKTPVENVEKPELRMMMGFKPEMVWNDLKETTDNIAVKIRDFRNKMRNRSKLYDGYVHLIGEVYDYPGEALTNYIRYDHEVTENLRKLFESNPLVLVVDASTFTYSEKSDLRSKMFMQDKELATFITGLVKYRATHGKEYEKDLIILFTKVDDLNEPVKNEYFGEGKDHLKRLKKAGREKWNAFGKGWLKDFVAQASSQIDGGILANEKFNVDCYFSWVGVKGQEGDKAEDPKLKVKVIRRGADRNVFPVNIYEDMIENIREKLREERVPDGEKKVKEFYEKGATPIEEQIAGEGDTW